MYNSSGQSKSNVISASLFELTSFPSLYFSYIFKSSSPAPSISG